MKAILSTITTLLVVTSIMLVIPSTKAYPSRELRKDSIKRAKKSIQKFENYFHSYIKNDVVVKVHILRHWFPGQKDKSIWYKRVTEGSQKTTTYTRKTAQDPWTELPKQSTVPVLDKQKNRREAISECSAGWQIGKVVARTITYFALNQDKLKALLGARTQRDAGLKGKQAFGSVNLEKVTTQIKAVIERTVMCIRERLMLDHSSMKEKCIHKAIMKEAKILIEKIKEKAQKHGFICSYAALKEGECQLSKLDEIIELKEYA